MTFVKKSYQILWHTINLPAFASYFAFLSRCGSTYTTVMKDWEYFSTEFLNLETFWYVQCFNLVYKDKKLVTFFLDCWATALEVLPLSIKAHEKVKFTWFQNFRLHQTQSIRKLSKSHSVELQNYWFVSGARSFTVFG